MAETKSTSRKKKIVTKKAPTVGPLPRASKVISFHQWAARRGIKKQHLRGMRAFVSNPNQSRSLEEWDSIFEKY